MAALLHQRTDPQKIEFGAKNSETLKPVRLLVIDDQESAVDLLRHAFAKLGDAQIEHIADGQQAQSFLASPASDNFDAIILDWKMPGFSGEDLADSYLATHSAPARRPLVMMSSAFPPAATQRLQSAGVLVIDKPMGMAAYYRAAQQVLDHCQPPLQPPDASLSLLEQLKRDTKLSHQTLGAC